MAFGNKSRTTRQYSFEVVGGLSNRGAGGRWIDSELRRCNDFWNKLVTIRNEADQELEIVRRSRFPEYDERIGQIEDCRNRIEDIKAAIKADHSQQRRRTRGTDQQREEIRSLQEQKRRYAVELQQIRQSMLDCKEYVEERRQINERGLLRARSAYHESGLWWANADAVKLNFDLAVKETLKQWKAGNKNRGMPRWHHYNGEGRLCMRLKSKGGGKSKTEGKTSGEFVAKCPVSGVFKSSDYFGEEQRIRRTVVRRRGHNFSKYYVPESVYQPKRSQPPLVLVRGITKVYSNGTKQKSLVCAHIKMASRAYAVLFWMHREFPESGYVTNVYLCRTRIGPRMVWKINFCVSMGRDDVIEGDVPRATEGTVAVDWNYRKTSRGLRVATWMGDDGDHGHLFLPYMDEKRRLDYIDYASEVQKLRSDNFNSIKARLTKYREDKNLPEWLAERLKDVNRWKRPGRLVILRREWQANRVSGDEEIFQKVVEWNGQDHLLYQKECNLRRKFVASRNHAYRNLAYKLSRMYKNLHIEDIDKHAMKRRPDVTEEYDPILTKNRDRGSPGKLTQFLIEKFGKNYTKVAAANSTKFCAECKSITEAGEDISYTCEHCQAVWDVDLNACRNLLSGEHVLVDTEGMEVSS